MSIQSLVAQPSIVPGCCNTIATRNTKISGFMNILQLTLHLLAMNLASAGPLLCIWLGRQTPNEDSLRHNLGQTLAWLSVWAMLLGMLTGGTLLYFTPSAGLTAAISRLPTRALWFAASELAFSLACLLLYAYFWRALRQHRWWHASLALLSSSNLLYHFPPLMSVLGKLAADPRWAKTEVLDRATLLPLMLRTEILALTTHFTLASLAVAAITLLWLLAKPTSATQAAASQLSRRAATVALLASALQLPSGIWLLTALPQSAQTAMMGTNTTASLAFVGALLLTFLLLQRLLTIAIGSVQPSQLRHCCWLLCGLVLLMTVTLRSTREKHHTSQNQNPDQEKSREANSSTASGSTTITVKPFVLNE